MTGVMVLIIVLVVGFALWTSGMGKSSNPPSMKGGGGSGSEGDGLGEVQSVTDALPLRQRAASNRKAATQYRDELLQKLKDLEATAATADKEQLALQRAEFRRELEWAEGRLHALPEVEPAVRPKKKGILGKF